jgi:hypothetical protein
MKDLRRLAKNHKSCRIEYLLTRLPPVAEAAQRPTRYERLLAGPSDTFGCILVVNDPASFPTEPSCLAYRELACLITLLGRQADVIDNATPDVAPSVSTFRFPNLKPRDN